MKRDEKMKKTVTKNITKVVEKVKTIYYIMRK